jgi:pyruvate dehydrogenase kinase 2/3/4
VDSFRDIRNFPEIRNRDDELAFTQMIKMIRFRLTNVVPTIALGVQQLKKDLGGSRIASTCQGLGSAC